MTKKRVLSGIRATGRLHLGNYLGMVKGMMALQENSEYEVFFMVADLHALTTPFDPETIKQNTRDVVLDYLAAGLNPEKASVFVQSHVREHIELSYLLSTELTIARLSHLPTYKDKVKQYPQSNTMALLYYPILMAADILLYKTEMLPVGDDQLPHLEITREIARKFNEKYKTDFPEPEQIKAEGHYVPSLTGEGKMSKSVEGSYINLTDDLVTIKAKLAGVPTDSGKGKETLKEGGVASLLTFVELFEGLDKRKEYEKQYQDEGLRYKDLKDELAVAIYKELEPIQERRKLFENDPSRVDRILESGAKKARTIASETLKEVKEKMGLL
ncbi:tryptophan--tRNA ligase [Candidatus Woesebacteria bacterium GWA1_41_8]|uniref:Tryptophan--tRNA ligase n=1 Tax=Candidatus Woesebacteria bacterium GWA1_41_8 TaxID=1802471 RepID=A0A1F7WI33_9BACT|nr:MAG: tryptophan--tRNA ligase [Candidatus Woesebacteria bacterium GWA1_41_8]